MSGRRRLLPDACYDFWAEDGRDGEEGSRHDSIDDARDDASAMRSSLPSYMRPVITVEWAINERKVLRLLGARARRERGGAR